MKKQKRIFVLCLLLVMSMVFAACSSERSGGNGGNEKNSGQGSSKNAETKSGSELDPNQVLHLSDNADVPDFDIHHAVDKFTAFEATRSGLVTYDDKRKLIPDMADSMPKVNDKKTVYTFTLRDGIKWSDGKPVTAQDFVYSWRRGVDPKTAGEYARIFSLAGIKNAAKINDKKSNLFGKVNQLGIKALNEKKLRITLDKPIPYFLDLMTFPTFDPLRKDMIEKYGDKYATDPDKMLYNGPFVLSSWNHGDSWTFKKNPLYWNADQIKLQEVQYKVVKQTSTQVNLYNTNQLDFVEKLTGDYLSQFKDKDDFHTRATSTVGYMNLNEKNKALANKDIRIALYNGFDRDTLTKVLLKDGSLPAWYFVPKNLSPGPKGEDFRAKYPEINKLTSEQTKKTWEKGLKEIGEKSVTLELLVEDDSYKEQISTFLKDQWEKNLPGLTINIKKQPSGPFLKLERSGDFDIDLTAWWPDFRDPINFLDLWTTDNHTFNAGRYSNPKYDALIQKVERLGAQPEKRWEVMQEAEKVLLDDAGIITTFQYGTAYIQKPYVKNIVEKEMSGFDWRYAYIVKH